MRRGRINTRRVAAPSRITVPAVLEGLESRRLMAAVAPGGPSAREQQMLDLVNRLRTNPAAELPLILNSNDPDVQGALAFWGVDRGTLARQWQKLGPVAPLAWNDALARAARGHTQRMLDADQQSHQLPGEAGLLGRASAAGYAGAAFVGENVYAYMDSVWHGHAGFAVDWGDGPGGIQSPAGHRDNLMTPLFTEVGVAILDSRAGKTVGPYLTTQNFGSRRGQSPFLLGAVYDDRNANKAYDAGEGVGGATVIAVGKAGTFSASSWASGGYQLQLPAGGYTVYASGGGLRGIANLGGVTIGGGNVKRDLTRANFKADTAGPTAKLTAAAVGGAGGQAAHTFTVDYADTAGVNWQSLDSNDLTVTGLNGFAAKATLVSVDAKAVGLARRATYRVAAPGGFFDSADNGTYAVSLGAGQVTDLNGLAAAGAKLGTFSVAVPPATLLPSGVFVLNGTAGNDDVSLTLTGSTLTAKVNGVARAFNYAQVKRVYVAGLGGNDRITLGRNLMAATLDGGTGNDTITGTDRDDTLQGQDGNDCLLGGLGNDVFFGGAGRDTVDGGAGGDRSKKDPADVLAGVETLFA